MPHPAPFLSTNKYGIRHRLASVENFTHIWGSFYAFSLKSALGWSLFFHVQFIENDITH
jgi:hypothetical protein